jgi:amino-acid N-acetyltransferase
MSQPLSWRLRAATSADAGAVLSLLRDANLPKEGVLDRFPEGYVVAESGGGVIAVAGLESYGNSGLLRSLVVSPLFRGQGIGEGLIGRLLSSARSVDLDAVCLLTNTAREYLARRGFTDIGRESVPTGIRASVEFASAGPASAACMFMRILSS